VVCGAGLVPLGEGIFQIPELRHVHAFGGLHIDRVSGGEPLVDGDERSVEVKVSLKLAGALEP